MSNGDDIPSHCYLSISIAGGPPENVVIQLEKEKLPITCRNFARLCAAPGVTSKRQPLPTYRGTDFHRIVSKFMVQGGDFEKFDGTGGYSIYKNNGTFKDEGLRVIPHAAPGVVSMANRGKDTNGSQFFVTLEASPHLNDKHVAFGQVVEGMNVIHQMATVELEGTRPVAMQRIVIRDCGHGRGPARKDQSSSGNDLDSSTRKQKKKDKKKRKKHHSKRRKRDRRRDYSDDDDDSSSSSSTDDSRRRRKKKSSKKHKRRKRRHSSDSDDESSTDERRRSKSKHKHRSSS